MIIKVELADGTYEIFESSNYKVSTIKDMHPMIVKITIYTNTKKIAVFSRPFKWFYKQFTFKSEKIQKQINNIYQNQQQKEKTELH